VQLAGTSTPMQGACALQQTYMSRQALRFPEQWAWNLQPGKCNMLSPPSLAGTKPPNFLAPSSCDIVIQCIYNSLARSSIEFIQMQTKKMKET